MTWRAWWMLPLLEQGTSVAGQLDDPATRAFAAYCAGNRCLFASDVPQAIAHFEGGLAALPAAAVRDRQRANLLLGLVNAAGARRVLRVVAGGAGAGGLAPG